MSKITISLNVSRVRNWGRRIGYVALLLAACFAIKRGYRWYFQQEADTYVEKGFLSLSSRLIQDHPDQFLEDPNGCRIAISSFVNDTDAQRLRFAVESCLNAEIHTAEVLSGLALLRDMTGDTSSALEILESGAHQYPESTFLRLVQIRLYLKSRRTDEAITVLKAALASHPRDKKWLQTGLELYLRLQMTSQAAPLADRLKELEPNPDPASAALLARAKAMMGSPAPTSATPPSSPKTNNASAVVNFTTLRPEDVPRAYPKGLPPNTLGPEYQKYDKPKR